MVVFRIQSRPIRIVLRWQFIATAVLTLASAILWGKDGAVSAALGGAVNLVSGWVYGWVASWGAKASAGEALRTMFRAEAAKVLVIIVGLWLVLANYRAIVHAAFLAAFAVTVAIFAAAIAVREGEENKGARATGHE